MSVVNSSQLHILKVEVAHGSDRHEISIYSAQETSVQDLLEELEKKTRVPISNIQIIFKGQKLHLNPKGALKNYGVFSGSRLLMVGERLPAQQDAIFRRILGINKDVGLIEKSLNEAANEFALIEAGSIEKTMIKEYLPQMHQRVHGMRRDLETFGRVLSELDSVADPDLTKYRAKTSENINNHINRCSSLLQGIAKYTK